MKKLFIFLAITISIVLMTSFRTPPQRMLFVGDSLTCYSLGWQHQVATQTGHAYTNLAVGGYRMEQMKYKLDAHLKKDSIYSKAFIYGGCNDGFCYIDLNKSLKTTQAMVDSFNRRGIKPVVVIGFDASTVIKKTVYDEATTVRSRNRYAQLQKMMVDSLKNCQIIPYDPNFKYEDTADGIHFKASGHKKIADWVLKHL
jgi:hypothetical protein